MTTSFAAVLAELRGLRGLSQSRLAHEAGFDHSYISRLEAGKREPSRETVLALSEVMELDTPQTDSLLVAAGYRPTDDSNLFADEPAIAAAARLLRDPELPEAARANFRELMTLLVRQWGRSAA
ncbi:MAG: helix-turn-helix domain-containing protein [Chloroflexi bacterium]|nr:helix-turn-helix domain-containing protein [Chloroflexota bacterium]